MPCSNCSLQFLVHQLRIEVWHLSITVVSQKMLTVLTSSLVQCLTPTAQCFWKDPKDVHSGVKTRSQSVNQSTVSTEDYKYYFLKKQCIEQWISGIEKYTTKALDRFFIV